MTTDNKQKPRRSRWAIIFSFYFNSWWVPVTVSLAALLLITCYEAGPWKRTSFFADVLAVMWLGSLAGILLASVWNYGQSRLVKGTFNLLALPLCFTAGCVVIVAVSRLHPPLYPHEEADWSSLVKKGRIPHGVTVVHLYSSHSPYLLADNEHLFVVSNLTDNIWESFCTNCDIAKNESAENLLPIPNKSNDSNMISMQALLLNGGITNVPATSKIFFKVHNDGSMVDYIRLTNKTTYILVMDL